MSIEHKQEGSLYITFGAYLDGLKVAEKQKPPEQRKPIPTIKELADVVGVHQVTLTNIVTGHIDRLSIDTARKVMDEMWRRGFRPEITDFIKYVPPEVN
jgi:pentatricopeptide repeat protein